MKRSQTLPTIASAGLIAGQQLIKAGVLVKRRQDFLGGANGDPITHLQIQHLANSLATADRVNYFAHRAHLLNGSRFP